MLILVFLTVLGYAASYLFISSVRCLIRMRIFTSLGCTRHSGIAGSCGSFVFNVGKNLQKVSQSSCTASASAGREGSDARTGAAALAAAGVGPPRCWEAEVVAGPGRGEPGGGAGLAPPSGLCVGSTVAEGHRSPTWEAGGFCWVLFKHCVLEL